MTNPVKRSLSSANDQRLVRTETPAPSLVKRVPANGWKRQATAWGVIAGFAASTAAALADTAGTADECPCHAVLAREDQSWSKKLTSALDEQLKTLSKDEQQTVERWRKAGGGGGGGSFFDIVSISGSGGTESKSEQAQSEKLREKLRSMVVKVTQEESKRASTSETAIKSWKECMVAWISSRSPQRALVLRATGRPDADAVPIALSWTRPADWTGAAPKVTHVWVSGVSNGDEVRQQLEGKELGLWVPVLQRTDFRANTTSIVVETDTSSSISLVLVTFPLQPETKPPAVPADVKWNAQLGQALQRFPLVAGCGISDRIIPVAWVAPEFPAGAEKTRITIWWAAVPGDWQSHRRYVTSGDKVSFDLGRSMWRKRQDEGPTDRGTPSVMPLDAPVYFRVTYSWIDPKTKKIRSRELAETPVCGWITERSGAPAPAAAPR